MVRWLINSCKTQQKKPQKTGKTSKISFIFPVKFLIKISVIMIKQDIFSNELNGCRWKMHHETNNKNNIYNFSNQCLFSYLKTNRGVQLTGCYCYFFLLWRCPHKNNQVKKILKYRSNIHCVLFWTRSILFPIPRQDWIIHYNLSWSALLTNTTAKQLQQQQQGEGGGWGLNSLDEEEKQAASQ